MESYTFRCDNDDCGDYKKPISGITMVQVIDDGGPVCGLPSSFSTSPQSKSPEGDLPG